MAIIRAPRAVFATFLLSAAFTAAPSIASAQIGIGARMAWVTPDSDVDADRIRFNGGQVRLFANRFGLEVAMDRHSETFSEANRKITQTPIQASLLMRMGNGKVAPFLLAGPGWYRSKVSGLDGADEAEDVSSTEFGWHAGIGLEIHAGRHVGIHGDYRYTFLDFNGNDDEDEGFIRRLLPGHRGSMWTLGASFYF